MNDYQAVKMCFALTCHRKSLSLKDGHNEATKDIFCCCYYYAYYETDKTKQMLHINVSRLFFVLFFSK